MKLCNENKIPVTVRGAGTGLVGGSTPLPGRRRIVHHAT